MSKEIIYAIDFGTSNSLLAANINGKATEPIVLDSKNKDPQILRSLIYFPKEGSPYFGKSAIESYTEQSGEGRFVRSVKKHLPSQTFKGTQIHNQFYQLEDLIAAFLREMKDRADQHFGQNVESVILGRPAKFSMKDELDQLAHERLEQAARKAGFKHIDFFAEPLAAAFDYRNQIQNEKLVLIVDLGGGTSDFTVIKLRPNSFTQSDVLSLGGISVAGDAIDGAIMASKLAPHFGSEAEYRMPLGNNILKMPPALKYQLMSPADIVFLAQKDLMSFLKLVRRCSIHESDTQKIDQLFALVRDNLGFSIYEEIDRVKRAVSLGVGEDIVFHHDDVWIDDHLNPDEFNEISSPQIAQIFSVLDQVMEVAGVKAEEIDMICCTGGTSKISAVRVQLEKRFGRRKMSDLDSFQSVIRGLAMRAGELNS